MSKSRIWVLATGGTIAGMAGSALQRDYRPGQISIEAFLAKADELGLPATFSGQQIANIGSEDMGPEVWAALHKATLAALESPECDGVVITHGTDTAEETAFLFDLTLPTHKPVVIVGAMRPADAVGYDGLRNFANAVRVASDANAAGRGVLVVMGDKIFAARDVRKVHTEGTEAFAGFPRDAVGIASPLHHEWFGAPWRAGEGARRGFPAEFPEVPIVLVYAGLGAEAVRRQIPEGTKGAVVAGVGSGNMPEAVRAELAALASKGCVIVRASRVNEGWVERGEDDDAAGFVAARALTAPKARILLQLLLAEGVDTPTAVQAEFDRL